MAHHKDSCSFWHRHDDQKARDNGRLRAASVMIKREEQDNADPPCDECHRCMLEYGDGDICDLEESDW
jgi:hypothetical protein